MRAQMFNDYAKKHSFLRGPDKENVQHWAQIITEIGQAGIAHARATGA